MGFALLDYVIVAVYLIGVTVAGILISGRQRSSRDYFLGGKEMSWWSMFATPKVICGWKSMRMRALFSGFNSSVFMVSLLQKGLD